MGYEIERKFLVRGDFKSSAYDRYVMKQGYLSLSGVSVVRVRVRGEKGYITIKGAVTEGGITRREWEYEVPLVDAEEMLLLCEDAVIEKIRYLVRVGEHTFEVDEFRGANEGLQIAELELASEEETYERPDWLGPEVTGNVRYYNAYLSTHPYGEWKEPF
ncbi:MAG: CYTH domain-containing protein [bacterium]|nr:CYTH domain-containing protein [bacterium]MDD3625192.1 CYTH domain-containing protein [Proteiniphilum sp.]MDD3968624.1 CYTH domain-containing protein [Proteiniphilum sp.]MDD4458650.1 CYTH domain-containing protein [Proteiniphilum sp.]